MVKLVRFVEDVDLRSGPRPDGASTRSRSCGCRSLPRWEAASISIHVERAPFEIETQELPDRRRGGRARASQFTPLGEDPGERGLPVPRGTANELGLADASCPDRVVSVRHHRFLPGHTSEKVWMGGRCGYRAGTRSI